MRNVKDIPYGSIQFRDKNKKQWAFFWEVLLLRSNYFSFEKRHVLREFFACIHLHYHLLQTGEMKNELNQAREKSAAKNRRPEVIKRY